MRFVHAGGLHHAAVERDVAEQHGQAAFLRDRRARPERMQPSARSTSRLGQRRGLAERHLGGDAGRAGHVEGAAPRRDGLRAMSHWSQRVASCVLLCTVGTSVCSMPARSSSPRMAMMPPARCTSSMWYLWVLGATLHSCGTTRDRRSMSRHGEVDLGFLRDRQQVQDGVGRAAHGDVQRHGVLEGLEARWSAAARDSSSCS